MGFTLFSVLARLFRTRLKLLDKILARLLKACLKVLLVKLLQTRLKALLEVAERLHLTRAKNEDSAI